VYTGVGHHGFGSKAIDRPMIVYQVAALYNKEEKGSALVSEF